MAQLILFEGGDGGGIFIGERGVRPIPPLNPDILLQLRGLSTLLNGRHGTPPESVHEMGALSNRLSNLIFAEVEGIVGPLEGENSLVYQSGQGGFYCGSTGKPPIAFPWPPRIAPSIQNLIAAGLLARELIDFVATAVGKKMDILQVLEDPTGAAKELGIGLSERSVNDLHRMAPSQLEKIEDPVAREVVEFFHAVAKDGRFLSTWAIRPYAVAEQLKVSLSEPAMDRMLFLGAGGKLDLPEIVVDIVAVLNNVALVVTAIAVVASVAAVVVLTVEVFDRAAGVKDSSGLEKF
jgi:hypothetical protein